MKNNIVKIASVVGVILLIPVLGNLFAEGWNWGPLDFVVMGSLLFMTGLAIDVANQKLMNPVHKIAAFIVILAILFIIWIELAVDGVSQLVNILLG